MDQHPSKIPQEPKPRWDPSSLRREADLTGSSFRDPTSHLVSDQDGWVVRQFVDSGAAEFNEVAETGLLQELARSGLLVPFEVTGAEPLTVASRRIPIVTYPAEWTPSALREAALATLDIAEMAWEFDAQLKDASAYNLVFDRGRPRWVDLGSFQPGRRGIWAAYGQFCDHFLSPLLINERLGIPHTRLWSQAGIPVEVAAGLLPLSRHLDRTVWRHVHLRARFERSSRDFGEEARLAVRREIDLPAIAFPTLLRNLRQAITRLDGTKISPWAGYELNNSYDHGVQTIRDEFIERAIAGLDHIDRATDIGCNTGRHSELLARHFAKVVAVDGDPASIDVVRMRQADGSYGPNIWPVVANILDPTPGSGLGHQERQSFHSRFDDADLVLWMAVLHHLVIAGDLPLELFSDLMVRLGRHHVVEFVDPEDAMVRLLTASKGGVRHHYSRAAFEIAIARHFRVADLQQATETRWLYHLSPW